jgi:hypothetical protein
MTMKPRVKIAIAAVLAVVVAALLWWVWILAGTTFEVGEQTVRFVSADELELVMRSDDGTTLSYMSDGERSALTFGEHAYLFGSEDELDEYGASLYQKVLKVRKFYDGHSDSPLFTIVY